MVSDGIQGQGIDPAMRPPISVQTQRLGQAKGFSQ